jgi:hypothetical protein
MVTMKTLRLALIALFVAACGSTPPSSGDDASTTTTPPDASAPTSVCGDAKPTCLAGVPNYVLECTEDGGFAARACDDGMLCYQGSCQKLTCVPGAKECTDNGVRTCTSDGQGFTDATGTACNDGVCQSVICTPGAGRCSASAIPERCNAGGTVWEDGAACATATACLDGVCLPTGCKQGDLQCGPSTLYTCDGSGAWHGTACPQSEPCVYNHCVACVSDDACQAWETCDNGTCTASTPKITTDKLSAASMNTAYSFVVQEQGGKTPFTWALASGSLPLGLGLKMDGTISGTPTAAGTATFAVKVTDALNATDQKDFTLDVLPAGTLAITTRSLPGGDADSPYSATLAATGGQTPYGWMVTDPVNSPLPAGIDLLSTGGLTGTPTTPGVYPVNFRVFDSLKPPSTADQQLTITIKIAPLVITGTQTYNAYFAVVDVLPTLVQLIPYSTQLTASGGLKPYTWTEQPAPSIITTLGFKMSLPKGLTLNPDGTISGWVTDVSDATTIDLSWASFLLPAGFPTKMTGYFDYVQVTDNEPTPQKATAIIVLPTIPLTN